MSKISDLHFMYLHKKLTASGGTETQYTASAGTVRTATAAALTEANDFWNGAIVRWDSGPNAGLYSNVADFDAGTDTLTFDEDLPAAVASGHTFTMFHGGKFIGSIRIPGLEMSALVNITGFDLIHAGLLNGEGTGTLRYDDGDGTLSWEPPGEAAGAAIDISGLADGDQITLYGGGTSQEERSKYIVLERNASSLPSGDEEDDISLDLVRGSFLAGITGLETESGIVIYRAVGIQNAGADPLYSLRAYCATPFPDASSTTLSAGIGTGADTMTAASLSGWGTHGFVFNQTKNDVRYFYDRSGNTATIQSPGAGIRGKTAVAWDSGDTIVPFPWFDIGLDAPGALEVFEDPSTRETAPSGVSFSCPLTPGAGLLIGDLAADAVYCIWQRYTIPAGFRPIEGGRSDLRVYAEVTG